MKKLVTVSLPSDLRDRLKSVCALEGKKMNEVLVEIVNKWLKEHG